MTLIKQLTSGEVYVKNDCTPEEMISILESAFPLDFLNETVTDLMKHSCFGKSDLEGNEVYWTFYDDDEDECQKAISSKEFLKELNTQHEH
jgi:hypothetical protein